MSLWMVKTMTEEELAIHEERKTFIKTELNRFYKRKISHEKVKPLNEQYDEMMNFIKWDLDTYNYDPDEFIEFIKECIILQEIPLLYSCILHLLLFSHTF